MVLASGALGSRKAVNIRAAVEHVAWTLSVRTLIGLFMSGKMTSIGMALTPTVVFVYFLQRICKGFWDRKRFWQESSLANFQVYVGL